jgi:hypothetical protein
MLQQWLPSQRVQDFWQSGLHTLAHAGGEDYNIHKDGTEELKI